MDLDKLVRSLIATALAVVCVDLWYNKTRIEKEKIKQEQALEQKIENLPEAEKKYFKIFSKYLAIGNSPLKENQKGKEMETTELLKLSIQGKEAREYARNLAMGLRMHNRKSKYETLDSKVSLAKEVIMAARKDLQWEKLGGRSTFTLGYEYDSLAKVLLKNQGLEEKDYSAAVDQRQGSSYPIDSVQTFDEFFGPKDGRIFAGDCDDFSMALTTVYYALSEYAEANKGGDKFYKALSEGLRHYKIVGIGIPGHALNMAITIKDKPEFEIIEPQNASLNYEVAFRDGEAFIKLTQAYEITLKGKEPLVSFNPPAKEIKIVNIYNKEFSASQK